MTKDDDFSDFMIEGGDDLLNCEECPHCGAIIYLDQNIEWIDKMQEIAKCPKCEEQIKLE